MSKSALFQLKSWARFLLPSRYVAPYHPTPEPVVRKMLQLAKVSAADTVYDIGTIRSVSSSSMQVLTLAHFAQSIR